MCKSLLKYYLVWQLHFHFADVRHLSEGRHHNKEQTAEKELSKLSEK